MRSEQSHADRLRTHGAPTPETADKPLHPDVVVEVTYAQWESARVREGLAALTELQREALELAYYKGLTHREVAEALNVPLGTAKARLRDGLMKTARQCGRRSCERGYLDEHALLAHTRSTRWTPPSAPPSRPTSPVARSAARNSRRSLT